MQDADPVFSTLRQQVRGRKKIAIVGIGDDLSPPDRLGMDAARGIEQQHLSGVKVFFAGTVPESITAPLRRFCPGHVIFIDAADMHARPGTMAIIGPEQLPADLVTTHVLPLSVVMDCVHRETGSGVSLFGIQPDLSRPEKNLEGTDLEYLHRNLRQFSELIRDRMAGP